MGALFKLGVLPFQSWMVRVYDNTGWLGLAWAGTLSKWIAVGLLCMLKRGLPEILWMQWQDMLIIIGLLSVAVGQLMAIKQQALYRLLGYGAVAQMGWIVIAIAQLSSPRAALQLTASDGFAMLAWLGVMSRLDPALAWRNVCDLKGLVVRSPWWTVGLTAVILSWMGMPPTLGFFAKIQVIMGLLEVHAYRTAWCLMSVSVLSAVYYLRLLWCLYDTTDVKPVHVVETGSRVQCWILSLQVGFISIGFFFGEWLLG